MQFDRNSKKEEIEEKQKAYLTENSSSFANLVKESKERRAKKETAIQENKTDTLRLESREETATVGKQLVEIKSIDDDLDHLDHILGSDMNNEETVLVTDVIQSPTNNKRKSSSIIPKSQKPSKRIKVAKSETGNISTPTKPAAGQNIFTKLTQSAEQRKMIPKLSCPVCSIPVAEKFLNIHLDKCLQSGPGGSGSRSGQKPKPERRDSIQKHFVKKESDDEMVTTDEEDVDLDLSQEQETNAITVTLPVREKRVRTAVKPPIIESQEDFPENILSPEPAKDVKETSAPSSPILARYTETISQSQGEHLAPGVERQQSERDMFASDSEDGISTVSSNLLDKHIEDMMEEALKDRHTPEEVTETQSSSGSQRRSRRKAGEGTKHVTVSVVPRVRKSKPSTSQVSQTEERTEKTNPVRTTRRRTKKAAVNSDK